MSSPTRYSVRLPVGAYHLSATLDSGQAFRWEPGNGGEWTGVIGERWVRLGPMGEGVLPVETVQEPGDWEWLRHYLALDLDPLAIQATFPPDPVLQSAVARFPGLRLLRQDPWECLASFILSSTKRITQIRQVVRLLCERHGVAIEVPPGHAPAHAFPRAAVLAGLGESELRACRMGFRARYLQATAERVATGILDLDALSSRPIEEARAALMACPGVGRKIADCVLLFSCGFSSAFPVDVWVLRALREIYFPGRRPSPTRLRSFADTHFGPFAGHAQQYLFHAYRTGVVPVPAALVAGRRRGAKDGVARADGPGHPRRDGTRRPARAR